MHVVAVGAPCALSSLAKLLLSTQPNVQPRRLLFRSSKDRSDISIVAQRRALHELALTRHLVIVDEFVDAVESGKDEDRPGFQKLLLALKSQERAWEHVLVLDTSRIGRRRLLAQIFEQECSKRKAQIIYRSVPDTDPVTEMLLKAILQAMDEWHSLTSKQKGLAGMAENVRQGWRAGGRAPRGYRLVYHSTGAIRDGVAVTKSRLEVDEEVAKSVAAYLKLRAQGVARGIAIARTRLQWPATSVHSMDWQALTYAGHTVWNMHTQGNEGEKRRPRAEWLIKHDTHEALITTEEAEAILKQQEVAATGRRVRNSNLLLTGLVVCLTAKLGLDGCNFYRIGKGRKVAAARLSPQSCRASPPTCKQMRSLSGFATRSPVYKMNLYGSQTVWPGEAHHVTDSADRSHDRPCIDDRRSHSSHEARD